jgi:hypothetical protein
MMGLVAIFQPQGSGNQFDGMNDRQRIPRLGTVCLKLSGTTGIA